MNKIILIIFNMKKPWKAMHKIFIGKLIINYSEFLTKKHKLTSLMKFRQTYGVIDNTCLRRMAWHLYPGIKAKKNRKKKRIPSLISFLWGWGKWCKSTWHFSLQWFAGLNLRMSFLTIVLLCVGVSLGSAATVSVAESISHPEPDAYIEIVQGKSYN